MSPRLLQSRGAALAWRNCLPVLVLSACLLPVGCSAQPQFRLQKEEETDRERYGVRTVGDVSTFGNAEPVMVSGVGLVEGLEGTGCPAPPGELRQGVEHELRKQKVQNVKELLSSKDCALVLVQAYIPAAAKKGDPVDIEVALPQGSKATSLRGGYLRRCVLYNRAYAGQISERFQGTNTSLRGHPVVRAEGALLVGSGDGDEREHLKRGRIWGGGTCHIDRSFHIALTDKNQRAQVAANVASRVNSAFQGTVTMAPGQELAVAKTGSLVLLNVPAQYRLNLPRFLRVVRMVPLEEITPSPDAPKRLPYREQLAADLQDPARTVVAALRLEALGTESIPALKRGMEDPHPLVRFCSAESLAYLGSASCGEELARTVREQPYLRAFALTAMASLDEAVCRVKLEELMNSDLNDETRYGAFRALRALDERDPQVRGEELDETFWLHEVAPKSKPMVHFTTSKRAEIVLFGKGSKLVPPFTIVAGEYAITASDGAPACTISHVPLHSAEGGTGRKRCSLDLKDVIRSLADLGASYPEVVEVLRQADSCKTLSCRVRNDALPQAATVQQLAQAGKEDKLRIKEGKSGPGKFGADEEKLAGVQIIKPDVPLGGTPTLYQKDIVRRGSLLKDARALQREKKRTEQPQTAEKE